MTQRPHRITIITASALILSALATAAHAQLPQTRLYAIYPPGGKVGATFDLQVANAEDDDSAHKLVFSHPGITAKPKLDTSPLYKDPRPIDRQFEIAIGADVPPGIYEVRTAGTYGLSNPRAFVVGTLDEINEPGGNNSLDKAASININTIVNGRADQRNYDYFKVTLKKDQRVLIECAADDIDSRMTPVLTLYNAAGNEITRRRGVFGRDPLIDFTAPADGDYVVSVHDLLYEGGGDYFYRLAVRTGPYIDFIEPPAAPAGQSAKVTLFGRNLPGGKPSEVTAADGATLEQLEVTIDVPADASQRPAIDGLVHPAEAGVEAFVYQLDTPAGKSNPVRFGLAAAPITLETEPNDDPSNANTITLPAEFAGRFGPKRDRDYVQFEAKKDQRITVDLLSHRLGLPTDPSLLIQHVKKNDKGEEQIRDIQTQDDSHPNIGGSRFDTSSADPTVSFTAPEDGTYRVMIRNQSYSLRPNPRLQYRAVIRSSDNPAPPDYRVVALAPGWFKDPKQQQNVEPGATLLRRGGTEEVHVLVYRYGGFTGDVEVSIDNLPEGVEAERLTIPAGASSGAIVLRAHENAKPFAGMVNVIGKAKVGDKDVTRKAVTGSLVWGGQQNQSEPQARLTTGLALAVTDAEVMPFTVRIDGDPVVDMSRAGVIKLPIKVEKRDGFDDKISVEVVDAPRNQIDGKNTNIDKGKSDGEIELTIRNNCPLQSFPITLRATAQIEYKRNPAAVQLAEALKNEVEQTKKALEDEAKQAEEAKKAADAAFNQANDEFKNAKAEQQEGLRAKVDDAKKKKDEAEQALKAAQEMAKKAQDELKKAENELKNAQNNAKPKKMNVTIPAGAIIVKVTEGPIDIEMPAVTVKQDGEVEATLKITRKYGFDEKLDNIDLLAANGVGGVSFDGKVEIDKGQSEVKVKIKANGGAKPGTHEFKIRIRPRFNNQTLTLEQPFALTIEEKKEEKTEDKK